MKISSCNLYDSYPCTHVVAYTVKTIYSHKPQKNLSMARWSRLFFLTRKKQLVASSQLCLTLYYTSACSSISAPPCPSPSPPVGAWRGYYTFASELHFLLRFCVCVWILKMVKRLWEGKGAPAIALFFSSLYNPEEDKLWGTQGGSARDLPGSCTPQKNIPEAQLSDT